MARIIASIEKMEQRTGGTSKKRKGVPEEDVIRGVSDKKRTVTSKEAAVDKQKKKKKRHLNTAVAKNESTFDKQDEENKVNKPRPRRRHQQATRLNRSTAFRISTTGCLPPKKLWLKQWKSDLAKLKHKLLEPIEIQVASTPQDDAGIIKSVLNNCIDKVCRQAGDLKVTTRNEVGKNDPVGSGSFTSPLPTTGPYPQLNPACQWNSDGTTSGLKLAVSEQQGILRARKITSPTISSPYRKSFDMLPPFRKPWNSSYPPKEQITR